MPETRHYKFRGRPEAVSAARRALAGFEHRLELAVFYDASLCVSELVTNAVIHADVGAEAELELEVSVSEQTLRVSVTDPGRGFEPGDLSIGDESGWGLYIVDRLSDRWGVERSDRTKVWFELALGAQIDPLAIATGGEPAALSGSAAPSRRIARARGRASTSSR